jgi:hypothetical protein
MSTDRAELSAAVIALMKGVVYRDTHETAWLHVLKLQPQLRDHFEVAGLMVVVDEAEGYAYLRSRPVPDGEEAPPRLVARRSLSFPISLLLALLRKKLAEFDATSSETRLVVSRDQLVEMMRVFLPDSSNEARVLDQLDTTIGKAVDLGFLRRIRGDQHAFEVRRILKAFVDAEWLAELDSRLAEYAAELAGEARPTVDAVEVSS